MLLPVECGSFQYPHPRAESFAACYGKALKTFDAIRILCEGGYGEDAVILARSLVNVIINMGYIRSASDRDELARDFVAAGRIAHRDFMKQFPEPSPDSGKEVDWPAFEKRAKRWEFNIRKRAEDAGLEKTYQEHYRFGSSFEHSDAWSLASYWGPSDETNQQINDGPSDNLVEIALNITFMTMVDLVKIVTEAFKLPQAEMLRTIFEQAWHREIQPKR